MHTHMEKQAYDYYYELGSQAALYKLAKKGTPPAKQVMSFPPKKITPSKEVRGIVADKIAPVEEKLELIDDIHEHAVMEAATNRLGKKIDKINTRGKELSTAASNISKNTPSLNKPSKAPKAMVKRPINFYGEKISPIIPTPGKTDREVDELGRKLTDWENTTKSQMQKARSALRRMYGMLSPEIQKDLADIIPPASAKKPQTIKPSKGNTKAIFGRMQPMKMSK